MLKQTFRKWQHSAESQASKVTCDVIKHASNLRSYTHMCLFVQMLEWHHQISFLVASFARGPKKNNSIYSCLYSFGCSLKRRMSVHPPEVEKYVMTCCLTFFLLFSCSVFIHWQHVIYSICFTCHVQHLIWSFVLSLLTFGLSSFAACFSSSLSFLCVCMCVCAEFCFHVLTNVMKGLFMVKLHT